jgi:methyl-accepting chemotaxis protein
LAQRSADAAKEIKALITASGTQVATGVRLVGETGSALTRIVGQVEQLNGLMNSIAEAARAQTAGLGEVNAAMAQLGEVRQRNAAQIGQANATSQVLVQDAQALDTLMAQFQTGEAARQLAFAG